MRTLGCEPRQLVAQSRRSPSKVSSAPSPECHPGEGATLCKASFATATVPCLFFKLPPYDLIYYDSYAFQQLRLHFRTGLSSPGFRTEKVRRGAAGRRGTLNTARSHACLCGPGFMCIVPLQAWCRHADIVAPLPYEREVQKHGVLAHCTSSPVLPLPPAPTEDTGELVGMRAPQAQDGQRSVELKKHLLSTLCVPRGRLLG